MSRLRGGLEEIPRAGGGLRLCVDGARRSLPPGHPHCPRSGPPRSRRARIFERLGARPYLDLLDAALSRDTSGPHGRGSRTAGSAHGRRHSRPRLRGGRPRLAAGTRCPHRRQPSRIGTWNLRGLRLPSWRRTSHGSHKGDRDRRLRAPSTPASISSSSPLTGSIARAESLRFWSSCSKGVRRSQRRRGSRCRLLKKCSTGRPLSPATDGVRGPALQRDHTSPGVHRPALPGTRIGRGRSRRASRGVQGCHPRGCRPRCRLF